MVGDDLTTAIIDSINQNESTNKDNFVLFCIQRVHLNIYKCDVIIAFLSEMIRVFDYMCGLQLRILIGGNN